jgi:hypothetical protein
VQSSHYKKLEFTCDMNFSLKQSFTYLIHGITTTQYPEKHSKQLRSRFECLIIIIAVKFVYQPLHINFVHQVYYLFKNRLSDKFNFCIFSHVMFSLCKNQITTFGGNLPGVPHLLKY